MKKKIYIQILGVIACLAVVAMHVNGCFWQFSYDRYWITANIIECICYFAVPIFFMISGATLLNYRKRYTTAVFFKKKIWKNARSVSDLVCDFCNLVLYRISRKTGGHPGSGGWNSEYKICGYLLVFPGFVFRISVYPDPVLYSGEVQKAELWLCDPGVFCFGSTGTACMQPDAY